MLTTKTISQEYLSQDNRVTSCPIWVCVPKQSGYPKVFILDAEAQAFLELEDNAKRYNVQVCSVPRGSALEHILMTAIKADSDPQQHMSVFKY